MKMSLLEEIEDTIIDNCTLFGFEYNGVDGTIDPIKDYFYIRYGTNEKKVDSFEAVLDTPFVDGHTLRELSDLKANITITEQ